MKFELVQPDEYKDYYYFVYVDDDLLCAIEFIAGDWCISLLQEDESITYEGLINLAKKINDLNAATKADKLFGFL